MNICVCIKQVPDTNEIKVDPVTHTLVRKGVPSIVNPFDTYAQEVGVRLKEKLGGKVVVISMGPEQAKEAIKTCLSVGADAGYLISSRKFGGSDTLATSYILSEAIKAVEEKEGLKFAKDIHDVFGLKDNKNEGKELWETPGKDIWLRRKWEYKYITTIAYSGENKKKKNPYFPYYDDDKVNQNMFATTFIKVHPDFENIIPVKTKKDE